MSKKKTFRWAVTLSIALVFCGYSPAIGQNGLYGYIASYPNQAPPGAFRSAGSNKPVMRTYPVTYAQGGKTVVGINEVATPSVFQGNAFGLKWTGNVSDGMGYFPQYFKDSANLRVAVPGANSNLHIMDMTGKTLQTINLSKMREVLDISFLGSGIYFLNYIDGVYSETIKFIKTE